jgi:hypothetical protein
MADKIIPKIRAKVRCACGCGQFLNTGKTVRKAVLSSCWYGYVQDIRSGKREPPSRVKCRWCGREDAPALYHTQRYCDPDLTESPCAERARRAQTSKWNREDRARERGALSDSPLPWRDPPFDRASVCLTPSPCRYYSTGYGCPDSRVPCSDRPERGGAWEFEANGGSRCWEAGTLRTTGAVGASFGFSRPTGGRPAAE